MATSHFQETLMLVDSSLRRRGPYPYRRALAIGGLTIWSLGEVIAKRIMPKIFLSPSFRWFCKLFVNRRIFLLSTLAAKFFLTGYDLAKDLIRPDFD